MCSILTALEADLVPDFLFRFGFASGWAVSVSCFLGFVLHIFVASYSLFLLVFLDTLRSNKKQNVYVCVLLFS